MCKILACYALIVTIICCCLHGVLLWYPGCGALMVHWTLAAELVLADDVRSCMSCGLGTFIVAAAHPSLAAAAAAAAIASADAAAAACHRCPSRQSMLHRWQLLVTLSTYLQGAQHETYVGMPCIRCLQLLTQSVHLTLKLTWVANCSQQQRLPSHSVTPTARCE